MTGQIFVVPAGRDPDPYVRLVLELEDGREIRFRDIRKFGRIGLYREEGEDPFAATGPEPLADAFTVAAFRRRIRGRKGRLKSLLLDQSFIAGVGNIYADEALWAARLHPLRTARTLRQADERRLWLELRRILAEAVIRRGSSIDDYTAPEGDGEMQDHLIVYQRTGEPCLRCGRPIRRIVVGGNGAGKTTLLRLAAGRDEPDGGTVQRRRNLTIGLLAQESHFDAAFMAASDLRSAVRHGGARLEVMAEQLALMERDGRVEEP